MTRIECVFTGSATEFATIPTCEKTREYINPAVEWLGSTYAIFHLVEFITITFDAKLIAA